MIWGILLTLVLGLWLYFKFQRTERQKRIIGKRVLVEYFDQNYHFETIFPLTGTVTKKIPVGKQTFFVVQLDKSFCYENKDFDKIVIRERHAGFYIGDEGEIHVHIFLPKKELTKEHYDLTDFDHVVWATIKN
jgi:hypothetical protein